MKIYLINHSFPPDIGGGETMAYLCARTLFEFGHDVTVITSTKNNPITFPFNIVYLDNFNSFEKGENGLRFFVKDLYLHLINSDYDIVYCYNFSSLLALMFFRDILRSKIVFTFHSVPSIENNKVIGFYNDWLLEEQFAKNIIKFGKPDLFISGSDFFKEWAIKLGINKSIIRNSLNSVDLVNFKISSSIEEKNNWKKENNIPLGKKVMITPVRILKKKGMLDILKAAKKKPTNICFVIISNTDKSDKDLISHLESVIEKESLYEYIKVIYDKYDAIAMPKIYTYVDALLLPSYEEGLPMVILESMASKILVVTSDIQPLKKIVKHGVSGLMFPVGNVNKMIETINYGFSLSDKRKNNIIETAYKEIQNKYNVKKQILYLEKFFKGLLKQHDKR